MTDDVDIQARERVGSQLGEKWTLERLLGIGGMAAVYEGRHRNGARAAIKVLHPGLSRHAEVRERFLREGYAANKVEHPGAVKVLDDDTITDGPDAGTAYIVMELLEGESLQDRLERGPPLTETEFLTLAEGVLDVLDAAHTRGVVHRDLKPENLFLVRVPAGSEATALPRVKVLDFGLARLLDNQTITSHGLALGTPSFMSPEQAAGRIGEIDGRTDLFALGATGFRVRTGRRVQEAGNPVELVTKMANFAAPRIRTLAPEVSEAYARVVDRALEFKREDRYPDAASMRDDVRRALVELDGSARTVLAMAPPPSVVPVSLRPVLPSAPPLPPPRRTQPSGEPTVELSGSDLASVPGAPAPPPLPVVSSPPRRRRRSLLPWVTLLVLGGIGGKVYWDARQPASPTPPAPPAGSAKPVTTRPVSAPSGLLLHPWPSASSAPLAPSAAAIPSAMPSVSAAASASAAPVASASASAIPVVSAPAAPAAPAPVVAAQPRPAQIPAAGAAAPTPHRPSPKVGPANLHGLKHRKK